MADLRGFAVREVQEPEADLWDSFLASCPNAHVFQSWAWLSSKTSSRWPDNWRRRSVLVESGGTPRAAAGILYRRLPIPGNTLLWMPRGPSWREGDGEALIAVCDAVRQVGREIGATCLVCSPGVPAQSAEAALLKEAGLLPMELRFPGVAMPTPVMRLSLAGDESAMMAGIGKWTRHKIRQTEKNGATFRESHSPAELKFFHDLYSEMGRRKGFPVRPFHDFENQWNWLHPKGSIQLLWVDYDGRPVAGMITLTFGNTCWLLHTVSREAPVGHFFAGHYLHWSIMKWARDRGCATIDMRGAMGWDHPEGSPAHGVFRFKRDLGAELVHLVGEVGMVFKPGVYGFLSHTIPTMKRYARSIYLWRQKKV